MSEGPIKSGSNEVMIELRTLGGLSVACDGAAARGAAAQRKTLALLALLAAAGDKGISRDKLIGFLWPESDTEHGRNLLNQACYALRRDLHHHELFLGTTELRLNPDIIASDFSAFEGALAQGDVARAVEIHTGPFLDGFYLDGVLEFERWMEGERQRLAHAVVAALGRLATDAGSRGEHRAAADWWRRLAALDPLNSRAACGVMSALAALGEVPMALQHGRAYEALVRNELGSAPEASVSQLMGRLRLEPAAGEGATDEELRLAAQSLGHRRNVGYEKERTALREALQCAVGGRGLMVCVAGEPGSGKTTLVEDFLGDLAAVGRPCHVLRGRCSERLAGSGAYLPLLDALEGLLRGDIRGTIAHLMKQLAPNWYAQVAPALVAEPPRSQVPVVQAASQERLKREVNAFFREVCRLRPLVLFLDDVHWVDASTVDVLSYVANQMNTAQMLIVATYRPSELQLTKHPFGGLKLHLQGEGVCQELTLELLSREDIAKFLELEFPQHRFPQEFAGFIYAKTEGSPLFMVDLVRYLRAKQIVVPHNGGWKLAGSLPKLEHELPESARSMIERKIEQLSKADRELLTVAGVQGYEFDSAIVTQVLNDTAERIEARLEAMARVQGFVRPLRELAFPDGTPALRYRFVHVLYQNVLYARLVPTKRAGLSLAVAESLLGHYGERNAEVAAELGFLFEGARDIPRAVDYFSLAADRSASVFGYREVVILARRGLSLLDAMPDTPVRAARELGLRLRLGFALQITSGYADEESGKCMARAREICQHLGDGVQLFPALFGLWSFYVVRQDVGGTDTARKLAAQLLTMAEAANDPILLYGAHTALAWSDYNLGTLTSSHEHFEQAIAFYDPHNRAAYRALYRRELGPYTRGAAVHTSWLLGYPDRALLRSREAVALGKEIAEPEMLTFALMFAAQLHQERGEIEIALEQAEACIRHASEHGIAAHREWATFIRGWAVAKQGEVTEGLAQMHETLATMQMMGLVNTVPYFAGLLADTLSHDGKIEPGLATVDQGLAAVAAINQHFYEAELHRLRGELLLRENIKASDAEDSLYQALLIARRQQAKSLELRAATSLARLWQGDGKRDQARELLAPVYAVFTEGFGTRDLRDAKALLEQLA